MIKIGYKRVRTKNGVELNYNIIMEEKIGRSVKREEVVHHIDHDKTNDSPENLFLCECNGIHRSIHQQFYTLIKKLGLELLKLKVISFDKNKAIYKLTENKINQINFLTENEKKNLINLLKINKPEFEDIKKRRLEIIQNANQPKMSYWDTPEGRLTWEKINEIDRRMHYEREKENNEKLLETLTYLKSKRK